MARNLSKHNKTAAPGYGADTHCTACPTQYPSSRLRCTEPETPLRKKWGENVRPTHIFGANELASLSRLLNAVGAEYTRRRYYLDTLYPPPPPPPQQVSHITCSRPLALASTTCTHIMLNFRTRNPVASMLPPSCTGS